MTTIIATISRRNLMLSLLLVAFFIGNASAQTSTTRPTDGSTPLGMAPGSPAGSYALSDFENVNLFSGNLNFALPLLQVGGRGQVGYTMTLAVDQRWEVRHETDLSACGPGGCSYTHRYYSMPSLWEPIRPGYGPGVLIGRQSGRTLLNCGSGYTRFTNTVTRFTFMASDGTEYEFRDTLNHGQPLDSGCNQSPGPSRGREFVTADGTSATFLCDETIFDDTGGTNKIFKSGFIKFRDGRVYRINSGLVEWIRDRNGNTVKFFYNAQKQVISIIDSLSRAITITYNSANQPYDLISFKGFNGAARTIKIGGVAALGEPPLNILRANYRAQGFRTYQQLFPGLEPNFATTSIPIQPAFVELPDGRRSRLYYNPYSELARVELPTGGAFEYEWAGGPQTLTSSGGVIDGLGPGGSPEYNIYRRATEKRIYPNGGSAFETKISFIKDSNQSDLAEVETRDAGGSLVSKTSHYHHGSALPSFTVGPTDYPHWQHGREYKTETLDGINGVRAEHTWVARVVRAWAGEDPRIADTTTTLVGATLQASKQQFAYDENNNVTETWEYDLGTPQITSPQAGPLRRYKKTVYLDTAGYTGTVPFAPLLLSLPTKETVFDASDLINPKAKTTYEYDNYTEGLADRSNISGHARTETPSRFTTTYITRGNVTRVTQWLLPDTQLSTLMRYDIAGNVTSSVDPLNRTTSFNFNDSFGPPDGNARDNIQVKPELGIQATYAFVTQVTNALEHTAYSQRDYYTGRPVDGEDANGVVASGFYNDPLDRPTQVVAGANQAAGLMSQTTFIYDDPARTITTTGDLDTFDDNQLKSQVIYDGLGRTVESRRYESELGFIATKQTYDAMGRAKQMSNPYRPGTTESLLWTTTGYDRLSRVVFVKTPDNAMVNTSYMGNQVTVTDQAEKKRRSIMDGMGRVIRVDEPNPAGSLGSVDSPAQPTTYGYDALDNLTSVTQGSQARTFAYDSLRRLTQAMNPESGTIDYDYDGNGNLRHKTDDRDITTTFAYDALNRLTGRSYSTHPENTSPVSYFYDDQALPAGAPVFNRGASIGRLVATTYGGGSAGSYQGYDALGRTTASSQKTDTQTYQMGYGYNLANMMTSETYPSGKTVTTGYDVAGRISQVSGQVSGEPNKTYGSQFLYAAHGAVKEVRLGNLKWEHTSFNNRLQPEQIGLGTSGTDSSLLRLDYTYGSTDNNGNILTQTVTAPQSSGGNLVLLQTYFYDSVNRLQTAEETRAGSSQWKQTYDCDRFGNRAVRASSYLPSPPLTPQSASATDFSAFNQSNNRLSQTAFPNVTYDPAGNLTRDQTGSSFAYDADNRLKTSAVGGVTASYEYDGGGQRIKKVSGTTTVFVYNAAGQMVAEYGGQSPTVSATSYLTTDHLGSTRVVTTQSGAVKARYDYLPYGEEVAANIGSRGAVTGYGGTDSTKQKFTGYERDGESNLDYAQARYYSSAQGRFTSVDPENAGASHNDPQSWNGYAYARSNPLLYVDPDGRTYMICGPDGCGSITDEQFARERDRFRDPENRLIFTGGKNVYMGGGNIYSKDGEFLASYQQISIDDQGHNLAYEVQQRFRDPETWKRAAVKTLIALTLVRAAGGMRAAGVVKLRDLGLEGVELAGKSFNSGRKALEDAGFRLIRTTNTSRKVFRHPATGATVTHDSGKALGAGQKPHWTIQDRGGQFYTRSGRPVDGPHPNMGGKHIQGG